MEVEGNFADSVNGRTGALMSANTNQLFPEPTGDNFNVPELSFAQFVSPYLGAVIGKLDPMGGDANAFADGKGDQQFFNLAFNINPVAVVPMPYSPLAAGVIVLPTKDPEQAIAQFLVAQSTGTASTPGFDALAADNLTFSAEGRLTTHFFGRTGHGLVGGMYSNREFTSIDQRIAIPLAGLKKEDGSWAIYCNFDQYVWQPEENGTRGIGLFGRFGASDGYTHGWSERFQSTVSGSDLHLDKTASQAGDAYNETVYASGDLVSHYHRGFSIGFETLSANEKKNDSSDGGGVRFSGGLGHTIFD